MLQLLTEATVDEKVTHLGLGAIPLNLCLCTTHTVMGSGATSAACSTEPLMLPFSLRLPIY